MSGGDLEGAFEELGEFSVKPGTGMPIVDFTHRDEVNQCFGKMAKPPNWHVDKKYSNGRRWVRGKKRDEVLIASIGKEQDGKVWLHVSYSRPHRMPSYEDLLQIKKHWIGEMSKAIMVFPPKEFHVSIHEYCLHLWCCLDEDPLPEFSWGEGRI